MAAIARRNAGPAGSVAAMGLARRIALASLLVGGAVLSLLAGADPFLLLSEVPFAAVGAVLVIRRPGNTIGWLLIAVAAFATLSAVQLDVPVGPLVAGTAPLPERTFAWLTAVIGFLIFPSYALLALIFPSGRVPGGRWGRAVRVLIALNVILVVGIAVGPTVSPTMIDGSTIDAANPFALLPASSWWDGFSGLTSVVIFLTAIVAIGSFVLRLRTARGLERQQLRWVVASLVLSGVAVAVALFTGAWGLAFIAFATIPIAIGIAVLRYRLYDVDRLISRTLGYGALAAMLAAAYVGSVLLLSALLAPFTSANSLVVAGSTLLVAALFAPVRRRVQSIVDRRFDRTRYDGARELADLSQRLRSEVDLDGVKAEVVATIGRTLQPVSVSVWLIGRSDPAGSQPEPSSAWATTRSSM